MKLDFEKVRKEFFLEHVRLMVERLEHDLEDLSVISSHLVVGWLSDEDYRRAMNAYATLHEIITKAIEEGKKILENEARKVI